MGKMELLAYMRTHRLAVISSVGDQGEPQSALVGIAVSPSHEVIFDTVTDSRKHRNLLRDPRASVVLSGPEEKTLQLEGRARPLALAGETDADLRAVYYDVWPDGRERLRWPNLAYWCIQPAWAPYSDFAAGPLIEAFVWPVSRSAT